MPLDAEDEDLIARYRANRDPAAARRILAKFDRWMRREAGIAARRYGIEFEDALQASRLGLMDAVENYDASQGAGLLTYASWKAWPHQARERALARGVTPRQLDEQRIVRKAKRELGDAATDETILAHLDWTPGRLEAARTQRLSLDAPLTNREDANSALDVVPDRASLRPDALFEDKEHRSHVRAALLGAIGTALTDRTSRILMMYFEAGCETGAQGAIADKLGVTRQYVSLTIKNAMPRLRRALELNGIRPSAVRALEADED